MSFERSFNSGDSLLEASIPRYISGGYDANPDPKLRGFYLLLEDVSENYSVNTACQILSWYFFVVTI